MERVVVLAGSLREANAYCRDKGIRATFVSNSKQINHATKIIELPGFERRRDRFALAQSRDARIKFGHHVSYLIEADWTPPKPPVEEVTDPEQDLILPLGGLPFGDLNDDENLAALKAALNEVGLTLKKLPQKTKAEIFADAPELF
jgi:hypothetical protein